jgi:hypothetical protein
MRLLTAWAEAVHRQDQSQQGSSQNAWLHVEHVIKSALLQGREQLGQVEDFGNISIFATMFHTLAGQSSRSQLRRINGQAN